MIKQYCTAGRYVLPAYVLFLLFNIITLILGHFHLGVNILYYGPVDNHEISRGRPEEHVV